MTPRPENITKLFVPTAPVDSYPDSIDWRTKGAVSGIKDQVSMLQMYMFVHVCISN